MFLEKFEQICSTPNRVKKKEVLAKDLLQQNYEIAMANNYSFPR